LLTRSHALPRFYRFCALCRFLFRSSYGLLMLLPQSVAFKMLRDRLDAVSSLTMAMGMNTPNRQVAPAPVKESKKKSKKEGGGGGAEEEEEGDQYSQLLAHFEEVQAMHAEARRQVMQKRSLLRGDGSAGLGGGGAAAGGEGQ
jgi:vacuole morphology and inheritance protein 14